MPLPFALLLAFPIGVAFAWIARADLAKHEGSVLNARSSWISLAFGVFVLAPQASYFTAFHGDWAYLYWIPWKALPSAVDFALVIACAALVAVGHAIGAPLAAGRKSQVALALFTTPMIMAAGLAIVAQNRLGVSATYAQFHGGFGALSIAQTSLGRAVLLALAIFAGSIAWCVQLLKPRGATRRR